ncbi:MAG: hypothetical protein M1450_00460 [Patescibacteria group bacterium]|nr:hypothetical protein [Patescibacteria group bacterium]
MRRIFLKIAIILIAVTMLSMGTDLAYRRVYDLPYFSLPKNLWIYPEIPDKDKYELVKVGNSHAEEGVTFERYNIKSLNLSSVAQSFEFDQAMLKMHANEIKDGAVIVINISPISFSQAKPDKEDTLQIQYFDGRLSPFLIPHLKVEDYLQTQIFPFFLAGDNWRKKFANEIKEPKTQNAPQAKPKPAQNAPVIVQKTITTAEIEAQRNLEFATYGVKIIQDKLASPSAAPSKRLTDSMYFTFDRWYHTKSFNPQYFSSNRKDLEALIRYALKKKWKPVLITVPISGVLRKGLLPDYMQVYLYDNIKKTNLQGIPYFDFSNHPITQKNLLYYDADHLNKEGSIIFSYILLQQLIKIHYLPQKADGYIYP